MQRRSKLDADEFNDIVEQKLNPNMTTTVKTIFEVAEERAEQRGEQRGISIGQHEKARLSVLRGRYRGASADFLADISELPYSEVENILKAYDQVRVMWLNRDFENKNIEHLSISEVNYLLDLFDK